MASAIPDTIDEWSDHEIEESMANDSADVSRATSGRETSSRTNGGEQNEEGAKQIRAALSKEQSKNVFRLKLWVLAVLCLACGVLGVIMHQLAAQAEMDTFESQYDGAAAKLIDSFEAIMDHMGAVASLGMTYSTIVAANKDENWPLVSLDDFYEMANHARHLSGALAISMYPIVIGDHFEDWNQYATNKTNQEWIVDEMTQTEHTDEHGEGDHGDHHEDEHNHGGDHGHRRQRLRGLGVADAGNDNHHGEEDDHDDHGEEEGHHNGKTPTMYRKGAEIQGMHYFNVSNSLSGNMWVTEQPGEFVYLPRWQTSPFVSGDLVNYNLLKDKDAGEPAAHVMHSGKIVIGGYLDAPPGNADSHHPTTALLATLDEMKHEGGDHSHHHHGHGEGGAVYPGDPMSYVLLPIFDKVSEQGRNVVGVITALVHWLDFFSDILPDSVPAITIVLQYECQDGFVHDHSGTMVSFMDYYGLEDEGEHGHHRRRAQGLSSENEAETSNNEEHNHQEGHHQEDSHNEMHDHSDGHPMAEFPVEDHSHNGEHQMQTSQSMEHDQNGSQHEGESNNQEHSHEGHQIIVINNEEHDHEGHLDEASHIDEHDGHQMEGTTNGVQDHHEGHQMGESNNEQPVQHDGHQMGGSNNDGHDHHDGHQMGGSTNDTEDHLEGHQMGETKYEEYDQHDGHQMGGPDNDEHDHHDGHQMGGSTNDTQDHLEGDQMGDQHDGHQMGESTSQEQGHHEGHQMVESTNEEHDHHDGHQMGDSNNEEHGHHEGHQMVESTNEENDYHDGHQMGDNTGDAQSHHDGHLMGDTTNDAQGHHEGHQMGESNKEEHDQHDGHQTGDSNYDGHGHHDGDHMEESINEEHGHHGGHQTGESNNNGHYHNVGHHNDEEQLNHGGHHDGDTQNEDHDHNASHPEGESHSAEHHHGEESLSDHNDDHHDGESHSEHQGSNEHNQHLKEDAESAKLSGLFTYRIEGSKTLVVGSGDLHDPRFDKWRRDGRFEGQFLDDGTSVGIPIDDRCSYRLQTYPSQEFVDRYITIGPLVITLVIVAVFVFAIFVFCLYDRVVDRRQQLILSKATQSTALVASLFPKNIRERLLEDNSEEAKKPKYTLKDGFRSSTMRMGQTGLNSGSDAAIADLFPHCTVFFADIAGFTAWSSTREPSQVFKLLQSVYQAFDALAKRRRVFKVETIGDSYLAVTGLPIRQDQHATIMVRFAWDCLFTMKETVSLLESELGPETSDLSMRFGLHSGPVTAGVLRGDRARFQLFGDTVNTASRMESTGVRGMVQVSESTAAYLRKAGKDRWLVARDDAVKAKGKGVLATYWAVKPSGAGCSTSGSSCGDDNATRASFCSEFSADDRGLFGTKCHGKERLVDWVVQLFLEDIKRVVFARGSSKRRQSKASNLTFSPPEGQTCLQEIKEIIEMPKIANQSNDFDQVEIDAGVVRELGEFVTGIALMYRDNPFHNFEHACHVTMSVKKLLKRIVTREMPTQEEAVEASHAFAMQQLHDFTHGLSSDPLCMLAMTFSALIHDVDHRGISNNRLATEDPDMATKYNNKSVAEQNSLDLAWELLMEDRFATLRSCLFDSKKELLRFRQFIVNVVLATDIFDPELNGLRKKRWAQAFDSTESETPEKECAVKDGDRRATIVIEHIIQASDVSHTMQHWHIYQKWNRCLFNEMCSAYKAGRFPKDPVSFWYKGELGFFDNYVIPLAKKLEQCGVFGVSSDEYLNYALQNRAEWEDRGEGIVAEWVADRERGPVRREKTQVERLSLRHSHKPSQRTLNQLESNLNETSPESTSDFEDEPDASSEMDADKPVAEEPPAFKEELIKPLLQTPACEDVFANEVEC